MLSSISNSESFKSKSDWLKTWLFFFVMLLLSLFCYESWLEKNKHHASIASDKDLWSYHRQAVRNNPNAVVVLGASRAQLGLDMEVLRAEIPDRDWYQLTLNGQYPMATLEALANDDSFNGLVILSVVAQSLEPVYWDMQSAHNQYFETKSSAYRRMEAYLAAWIQSQWRMLHPELSLETWLTAWQQKTLPEPFYVVEHLDLSKSGDYSEQDQAALTTHFVAQKQQNYIDQPPILVGVWQKQVDEMMVLVNRLRSRGGDVVLLRMPTDQGHWSLDESYYPKSDYWDDISRRHDIQSIHFKDWVDLSLYDLPDSSHLDFRDAVLFSRNLSKIMIQIDIL